MIRKFRALGLAFLAVTAIGAVAAQAAHAIPQFTSFQYPATIEGTAEKIGERFVTEAGSVECEVSHFTGSLAEPSSTLTVHPTYTGCKAFGFLSATITTTGCDYVFHATERVELHRYRAHVDVKCEAGKAITITASTCAAKVESQTGLTTVDFTNTTNTPASANDVDVKPTVKGITYTVTNDGFLCPFSGTGLKHGGEYVTNEGETNKITIRCTAPAGTFRSCEVSGV